MSRKSSMSKVIGLFRQAAEASSLLRTLCAQAPGRMAIESIYRNQEPYETKKCKPSPPVRVHGKPALSKRLNRNVISSK